MGRKVKEAEPGEIEVRFDVKARGEAKWLVAKAASEANNEVALTWCGHDANGDGRAITLHQADRDLPDHKLAMLASWPVEAAGEIALAPWGWTLARDPEGARHWRPRARG